jgi:hypothetical protein
MTENPQHKKMMRYFEYEHLPFHLRDTSRPFYVLATKLKAAVGADPAETTVALRKLLEAKDAAVRAALRDD